MEKPQLESATREQLIEELTFTSKIILEASKFLSWNSIKVLICIAPNMKSDDKILLDQKTIQEKLYYKGVTSVISALKQLNEYGIITTIKDNNDKRKNIYFFNSYKNWKGELGERVKGL